MGGVFFCKEMYMLHQGHDISTPGVIECMWALIQNTAGPTVLMNNK